MSENRRLLKGLIGQKWNLEIKNILAAAWVGVLGLLVLFYVENYIFKNGSFVVANKEEYRNIYFSPDQKLIAFDYCNKEGCDNLIYEVKSGLFFQYVHDKGANITNLSFSPSGEQIVFVARKSSWLGYGEEMCLVTGEYGSSQFRIIGECEAVKAYPKFSSENHILFWRGKEKTDKKSQIVLAEVNKENGQTKSIDIENIGYLYRPSALSFFENKDEAVFSDYGISEKNNGNGKNEYFDKVWMFSREGKRAFPIETGMNYSSKPVAIKSEGRILFIGRSPASEKNGVFEYEIYSYKENSTKQLTNFGSYISGFDTTLDGSKLVLAIENLSDGKSSLVVFNLESKEIQRIVPKDISKLLITIHQ